MDINKQSAWQDLSSHQEELATIDMRQLFKEDPKRFEHFSLSAANLLLDYSKNYITEATLKFLFNLAKAAALPQQIDAMFNGAAINYTEKKAAMHIALRNIAHGAYQIQGKPISAAIRHVFHQMCSLAEKITNGTWRGYSDQAITDIVNIGIGGSDLGPAMVTEALTPYHTKHVRCHFVSNIDAAHILKILKQVNPETTLFIIASKSFSTEETLQNACIAREWLQQHAPNHSKDYLKHFIAITAHLERASAFGIPETHCLKIWDWVGGRYSVWSAISLPILLAIGKANILDFLAGAASMDQHFYTQPITQNMPVILALLGIWYHNFWHAQTHAILPYAQYLKHLPAYLQQADMESNGKSITIDGKTVEYTTGPIIWGEIGCNGQHAFHQLLHQGTHLIPVDFIVAAAPNHTLYEQHALLYANCISQSQALLQGKNLEKAHAELIAAGYSAADADYLAPHLTIPGNRPSNTLIMPKLTPFNLGSLLALYEHKIFTQGIIWNINSFDQWGVELGKKLAKNLFNSLNNKVSLANFNSDSSTQGLIAYYQQQQKR